MTIESLELTAEKLQLLSISAILYRAGENQTGAPVIPEKITT